MPAAICLENVSKQYILGEAHSAHYGTLRESLARAASAGWRRFTRSRREMAVTKRSNDARTIWALNGVSHEIRHGDVVGLIGRNGSGKSTLLKILSRITEPTAGRATVRGRVASLLEVGTGFHPELTGRENIYLNGSVLGMTRREIDKKLDAIVSFSGLEQFLETPVKRYSSGMQVRLAFAVAAHLEPEILIVDEVLAVGDMEFQNKCIGKMEEVSRGGRTVVFVSHNMAAIEHLCQRVVVLERGTIVHEGEARDGVEFYRRTVTNASVERDLSTAPRAAGLCPVIRGVEFFDDSYCPVASVGICEPLNVRITYEHDTPLESPYFGLTFEADSGVRVAWIQTRLQERHFPDLPARGSVVCRIPELPFTPRRYYVTVGCGTRRTQLDLVTRASFIDVTPRDIYGTGHIPTMGIVALNASWKPAGA